MKKFGLLQGSLESFKYVNPYFKLEDVTNWSDFVLSSLTLSVYLVFYFYECYNNKLVLTCRMCRVDSLGRCH